MRYEIKNIAPPKDVLSAMEKQMRAEREKRAVVLASEGERDAKINAAEGDKQRVIKASEANKQQQINEAEGQAAATSRSRPRPPRACAGRRALSERGGIEAMQLRIGEEYVRQFGKLARRARRWSCREPERPGLGRDHGDEHPAQGACALRPRPSGRRPFSSSADSRS